MSEQIFSIQQTAQRLDLSAETVRRMILEGEFPNARKKRPEKETSPYTIPLSDITAYERKRQEAVPFPSAGGR